jgi:acetyl esterase/lipase
VKNLIAFGIVGLLCAHPCRAALLSPEDVAFTATNDGSQQRYVLILPDRLTNQPSHDVLIALHGHGADRWQFVRDPRAKCRAARDVAAASGMIFVSPDIGQRPPGWVRRRRTTLCRLLQT